MSPRSHALVTACLLSLFCCSSCDQSLSTPAASPTSQPAPTVGALKAAPDRSLTPAEYVEAGAPAPDRMWLARDYQTAAAVLGEMAMKDSASLPRFESEKSGAYFGRLISDDVLAAADNQSLPVNSRIDLIMDSGQGAKQLMLLYLSKTNPSNTFDQELIELVAHQLRISAKSLPLLDEFVADLSPTDPHYGSRMDGVATVRKSLAEMAGGVLTTLGEKHVYRVEALTRLCRHLRETLPRLAQEMPTLSRRELPARLAKIAADENETTLRDEIQLLAQSIANLPASHLDALAPTSGDLDLQGSSDWARTTSQAARFSAEFPGHPVELIKTLPTRPGISLQMNRLVLRSRQGTTYTAMRMAGKIDQPFTKMMAVMASSTAEASGGDAETKELLLGKMTGREVIVRGPEVLVSSRWYADDGALYQIAVESLLASPAPDSDIRRFLDSFQPAK